MSTVSSASACVWGSVEWFSFDYDVKVIYASTRPNRAIMMSGLEFLFCSFETVVVT